MFPVCGSAIFYKSNRLLYRTNFASRLLARLTFFQLCTGKRLRQTR